MLRSVLLGLGILGLFSVLSENTWASEAKEERAFTKLAKAHHKLATKTQKKARKYLRSGRKLEKRSQKLWNKWVRKFDFPQVPQQNFSSAQVALEYFAGQLFYGESWNLIKHRALEMGGFHNYYEYLKKRRRARIWCRVRKGVFYSLAGAAYAGGIAAAVALPMLSWPTIFGPYGLVYLGVPAGANWGTLALIQALKGKCQ